MGAARRAKDPRNLSAIGATLKEERMNVGMTQAEVAKHFNVSLKTLRNLEQGVGGVSISTASQILAYFGKELRVGELVMSPVATEKSRPRKDHILEVLRLVAPVLRKKYFVKTYALFGSCARDEADKNSDIDIAVTFTEPVGFEVLGKITTLLETLFEGRAVDLVDEQKMRAEVKKQAKKEFIYVD